MKLVEIKIEKGILVDAWGAINEIEALIMGLRYCTDVFGEKHRYKIELPYVVNANINARLPAAAC
jgi:hypothetical protein